MTPYSDNKMEVIENGGDSNYCTSETVLNKSITCLEGDTFDCFPYKKSYSITMCIWFIINSVIGSTGNLLTIVALSYASHKKL